MDVLISKLLLFKDQWLLEWMLQIGTLIVAEYSTTAPKASIMLFSWSDLHILHGLSRTVGVQLGAKTDILDLLKETPVLFVKDLLLLFDDSLNYLFN